eukprot:1025202-Alexandrium_andersonii.AAC.1
MPAHVRVQVPACVRMCACVRACVRVRMHVHVRASACVRACVCVCVCARPHQATNVDACAMQVRHCPKLLVPGSCSFGQVVVCCSRVLPGKSGQSMRELETA